MPTGLAIPPGVVVFAHAGAFGTDNFISPTGVPIPAGTVATIYNVGTVTPAVLYSNRNRSAYAANPLVVGVLGNLRFYADPGDFDVMINGVRIPVTVNPDPVDTQGGAGSVGPQGPAGPQGPQGIQGIPGVPAPGGLTWRGVWAIGTAYVANDSVSYAGSTYLAVASSTGVTPGTDASKWVLLAVQGATGPQGPQGIQGLTGPQGPPGTGGGTLDPDAVAAMFTGNLSPIVATYDDASTGGTGDITLDIAPNSITDVETAWPVATFNADNTLTASDTGFLGGVLTTTLATHGYADQAANMAIVTQDNRYDGFGLMASDAAGVPFFLPVGPSQVVGRDVTGGMAALDFTGLGGGSGLVADTNGDYSMAPSTITAITGEVQNIGGPPTGYGGLLPLASATTLSFGGFTTASIAVGATAASIQTKLVGLTSIGAGNVRVSGPDGGPYFVTFTGTKAMSNQAAITASTATVVSQTTNVVRGGVIRQSAGINVATSGTITGNALGDDFTPGIAFLAHQDVIVNNNVTFIGPVPYSLGPPLGYNFAGSASVSGAFPGAAVQIDGQTQWQQSATGFGGAGVGFQNFKVFKNRYGYAANIQGHQGVLNVPTYMADGSTVTFGRCGGPGSANPATVPGDPGRPTGGEFARDGVTGIHQGICDYPLFATDQTHGGTLNDVVLTQFVASATFGQGVNAEFRRGFRYDDAQTNLYPCLTDSVQKVVVTATAGTFTLSYGGQTTTALSRTISPFNMQAALSLLTSIGSGNVTVDDGTAGGLPNAVGSVGPGVYYIRFTGALGGAARTAVTAGTGSLTGTAVVTQVTAGGGTDYWNANILGFTTYGSLGKQTAIEIPHLKGAYINVGIRNGSTTVYDPSAVQILTPTTSLTPNATQLDVRTASGADTTLTVSPQIGTGYNDGQHIWVTNVDISGASITFKHGNGLALPGNNALTLRPSQTAEFRFWAGGGANLWFCVGRSQAGMIDTGPVTGGGVMKVIDYGDSLRAIPVGNSVQLGSFVGADAYPRVTVGTAGGIGALQFGSGSAATDALAFDASLVRVAAGALVLNGSLTGATNAGGGNWHLYTQAGNSPTLGFKKVAANTNDDINIGLGAGVPVIGFGDPNADVATDTILSRQSAAVLQVTSALSVTGMTGTTAASRLVGGITAGPPTSGTHLVGDTVIDQSGRVWVCVIQSGDPGGGAVGAFGMVGSNYWDGIDMNFGTTTGSRIGGGSTQKLAFWGATPIVRPARVAALIDSSTGTASTGPGTLVAVGATYDQTVSRNNIATLAAKINALELLIHNVGLSA